MSKPADFYEAGADFASARGLIIELDGKRTPEALMVALAWRDRHARKALAAQRREIKKVAVDVLSQLHNLPRSGTADKAAVMLDGLLYSMRAKRTRKWRWTSDGTDGLER